MKLTSEELSSVIAQQKNNLKEQQEEEEEGAGGDGEETIETGDGDEVEVKVEKEEGKEKTEDDIMKEYGLEDYDQEEEGGEANLLGLGDLTSFADPKVRMFVHKSKKQLSSEQTTIRTHCRTILTSL